MGGNNAKPFKVHMFEEDFDMMRSLVLLHPGKETGGNLFGLWTDFREAVLHVVLGPAIGCTRTEVSFYQSIPYLQRVGKVLTEQFQLCHIGEWHSHHHLRLSEPSSGDSSTVTRNFPRGTCGFILIIANILPDNRDVTLSPYLYKEGSSTYESGEIKLLGRHRSPFKEVDVIRANIEQGEDRSSTIEEYRLRRAREVPKMSPPRPTEKSQEEGKFAYMFEEDNEIIQKHYELVVAQGARIEGDLLGLWTTDYEPVVHIALAPCNKNEPPPVSLNHQPKVTIQRKGHLIEGYPLENIGRYILCPQKQDEPSLEDSYNMRREYPDGGVLILVFRHSGGVAISPYLYNKGSEPYEALPMKYLSSGKVFGQNVSGKEGKDKEEEDCEKMEVDDPRGSPNFDQHKYV